MMAAILDVEQPPVMKRRRFPRFCNRQPLKLDNPTTFVQPIAISANWTVASYPTLTDGLRAWRDLPATDNLFLSDAYLNLLTEIELPGVQTGIAIFRQKVTGESFGLVLQAFEFSASQQLGNLEEEKAGTWWEKQQESFRRSFARLLEFRVLAAGQLLLTGDHHGIRRGEASHTQQYCELITSGLKEVSCVWPKKIHGLLLKDLPLAEEPKQYGYYPQP